MLEFLFVWMLTPVTCVGKVWNPGKGLFQTGVEPRLSSESCWNFVRLKVYGPKLFIPSFTNFNECFICFFYVYGLVVLRNAHLRTLAGTLIASYIYCVNQEYKLTIFIKICVNTPQKRNKSSHFLGILPPEPMCNINARTVENTCSLQFHLNSRSLPVKLLGDCTRFSNC